MLRKYHISERYETPAGEVECQIYATFAGTPDAVATVERSRVKSLIQGAYPHMVDREHQEETTEKK
jgi:hypothetical protein